MPPLNPPNSPSEYWRSLGDLERTPEFQAFLEREFPEDAQGPIGETTRRQFLKLMGASIALAGLTSCRWPEEKIAPFAHRPDGRVPGAPQYFATARELHGVGTGLVVTSYDGRPIKIEGNPLHPQSLGAADVWAQAGLLEMYDPERSRRVMHRAGSQRLVKTGEDFAEFSREMFAKLRDSKGAGLCVLSEASESPSVKDLRDRVAREMPAARWVEYEAVSPDNQRAGSALAFGRPLREHVNYAGAKVVVALDADPLMTHPAAVRNARDFAEGRQPAEGRMSRLYVFENSYTITGTMADHRYPTAAAAIPRVAAHLAAEVAKLRLDDSTARFEPLEALARFEKLPEELAPLAAIARDLMKYRGQCAVVAGPRQPARVHALVAWINVELRNYGQTITLTEEPYPERTSHAEALKALADDMRGGKVETLLILGGNPVYTAPPDLEFAAVLAKVPTTLHLSLYDDETSRLCAWHVPRAHYLESWGDTRAFDGTVAITQPLIAPLYDGKTPTELLENLLSDTPASGHEVVRRTFKQNFGEAEFDSRWSHALEDGVVKDSAYPAVAAPPMNRESIDGHLASLAPSAPALSKDNLELVFARDLKVQYKRSSLGIGWTLAGPLLQLVIYTLVFRRVLSLQIENYASFVFIGVLVWGWFQTSLAQSAGLITSSRPLVLQPAFPLELLPHVTVAVRLFHFMVAGSSRSDF